MSVSPGEGTPSPSAEELVSIINVTHGVFQAYENARKLKESLEAVILHSAVHVVPAPEGQAFELKSNARQHVGGGKLYGETSFSGLGIGMHTLLDVEPDTEPFIADRLAVVAGRRMAIDSMYNFRDFDTDKGDQITLIAAPEA